MNNKKTLIIVTVALLTISISCLSTTPQATALPIIPTVGAGDSSLLTAILSEFQGEVYAKPPDQFDFLRVTSVFILKLNTQVKTLEDGFARVDFSNRSIVRIGPNTIYTLVSEENDNSGTVLTRFLLEAGKMWIILRGGTIDVETPGGVAAVRGSYMSVEINKDTGAVVVTCLEGLCSIKNASGTYEISTGQMASIADFLSAPEIGMLSDAAISDWLASNPEASVVLHSLTSEPSVEQETQIITKISEGTNLPPTPSPTISATVIYRGGIPVVVPVFLTPLNYYTLTAATGYPTLTPYGYIPQVIPVFKTLSPTISKVPSLTPNFMLTYYRQLSITPTRNTYITPSPPIPPWQWTMAPTLTLYKSRTPSLTPTRTRTRTVTPTFTPSFTRTETPTPTESFTPTETEEPSDTPTPTETDTETPTSTPT